MLHTSEPLGEAEAALLRRSLCAWFEVERRDLPWRRDRDAYRVWISEAMLQQTRVEAVIPYYERFLGRLPDVAALAAASEDEVVALWSGLGYYRRARALRLAAQAIVERHGGSFPERRSEALALPGIGPYTAGAVLSIAYGLSEPLVDGNVARVFARLFVLEEPLGSTAMKRLLDSHAARLVPGPGNAEDPGTWNQALMELGALICVPRKPLCAECPVRSMCRGLRTTDVAALPNKAPKRACVDVRLELLLIEREGAVLLARRPPQGRMAGMWELPTVELVDVDVEPSLWPKRHTPAIRALRSRRGAAVAELKHSITHHRIHADVRRGSIQVAPANSDLVMAHEAELDELALTGMTRKALRAVRVRGRAGEGAPH